MLCVIGARGEEEARAGYAAAGFGLGVVAIVEPNFVARFPIVGHGACRAVVVD